MSSKKVLSSAPSFPTIHCKEEIYFFCIISLTLRWWMRRSNVLYFELDMGLSQCGNDLFFQVWKLERAIKGNSENMLFVEMLIKIMTRNYFFIQSSLILASYTSILWNSLVIFSILCCSLFQCLLEPKLVNYIVEASVSISVIFLMLRQRTVIFT